MRGIAHNRPSPAMVVASIALAVALGGTSYAAVNLPRHSVGTWQLKRNAVGMLQLKKNAVVTAKVKNRSLLALDFKKGQLPAGPAGAKGDKGETGATGPPGINLWAAFSAGAVFTRGSGVVGIPSHPSTGYFRVTFNRNITACAWLAEPASPVGVLYSRGDANTRRFGTSTDTIEVEATDLNGMVSDFVGFTLLVTC